MVLLATGKLIAYPAESCFGLGCDPGNKTAVAALFSLKQRSENKAVLLVASHEGQLQPWIEAQAFEQWMMRQYTVTRRLQQQLEQRFHCSSTQALTMMQQRGVTWLFHVKPDYTYLTGGQTTLGIRLSQHPVIQALTSQFQSAIVSTSANLSTQTACRTVTCLEEAFGTHLPVVSGNIGSAEQPSLVVDFDTGDIIRI